MTKALTLLLCTIFFFSCASLKKSLNPSEISGLYQSDSPCDDCRGIKTSILIKPDFSFEKTSLFLGRKDNYFNSKGNWKIENDSTISLNENGSQKSYRFRKNSLQDLSNDNTNINELLKVDLNFNAEGDFSDQKTKGIHFYATGNEPFWSLELIAEKSILFTLMGKPSISSKDLFISYQNGVTTYKSKSKKPNIEINVFDYSCVNDMSGLVSSTYVEVKINDKLYKGCGMLLNDDFLISGKWTLKFIKDYSIPESTSNKKPFINFNIQNKKINGNFGCNNFNGGYSINLEKLTLSQIVNTEMACQNLDTENKFSSAVQSINSFKIVNNELQLYKEKELLLSFSR